MTLKTWRGNHEAEKPTLKSNLILQMSDEHLQMVYRHGETETLVVEDWVR